MQKMSFLVQISIEEDSDKLVRGWMAYMRLQPWTITALKKKQR